jgi:uncharacterized repeat protein (TIGR03806 family)
LTAGEYPPGFVETKLCSGLTGATALAATADGRIFIAEQTGALRVVKEDRLLPEPCLQLEVDATWERGLIGVALDPRFPERPHVYVVYVSPRPYPHHRVSRFTAAGDRAVAGSEVVLLSGDDQRQLGGSIPAGHQGGGIRFLLDGRLLIGIGEQTAGSPAQRLDTFQGKLLRIAPDGSIPADNPFVDQAQGKYRAIWARGLRNPFGLAVHPRTGRIFVNDVGGAAWEEINEGFAGADYGWPKSEGATRAPGERGPLHAYERSVGKSITGGAFYAPAAPQFPAAYEGKYLFADFEGNWIQVLDPEAPRDAALFASALARPVDLAVAPDGSLLVLERNAWVNDRDFRPGTGSLSRVRFAGPPVADDLAWRRAPASAPGPPRPAPGAAGPREAVTGVHVPADPADLPSLLSHTGLFRSVPGLIPSPGIVPYDVIAPLWSDGAFKRRWIALPADKRIGFAPRGEWRFPPGTVFVKHFELGETEPAPRKRLETRLLVVGEDGSGYGATYKWRADGSDAELLAESLTEEVGIETPSGREARAWYYPSRKDCLTCHTTPAGFVLGVKTRQLNRPYGAGGAGEESQILAWNRLGLFDTVLSGADIASLDRLVPIEDESAPLAARARSYLDANCANCHRPGGARGFLDARWDTPLQEQNLLHGPLLAGDLEVPGSRVVVPGDVARSALHGRMNRLDVFKMPPLAMNRVDAAALAVVAAWVERLAAAGTVAALAADSGASPVRDGRFLRLHWYEPGIEHGNPVSNARFRVNSPEAVLHPSFGKRSEVRSSGMLQVEFPEDLTRLDGAELYLELWGGHPGTANRRVTLNGRSTYRLPVPDGEDCTHAYPLVPLRITDLVSGHNAIQFACDQGTSFWGHFIVDGACLRAVLPSGHPDLAAAGLAGFRAAVRARSDGEHPEHIVLALECAAADTARIARADFEGRYRGYDERGGLEAETAGWHGFTKEREPVATIGTAGAAPFTASWDVSMLPAQEAMAARAIVRFKDRPDLVYVTPAVEGLRTPERSGVEVRILGARDLPRPFWSRAGKQHACTVEVDIEPERIERAELHVMTWDGGAGNVKDTFTLNGRALAVAGAGKHDVIYSRIELDPALLGKGANRIELLSDTEHHGIEVLAPGPAIAVRARK